MWSSDAMRAKEPMRANDDDDEATVVYDGDRASDLGEEETLALELGLRDAVVDAAISRDPARDVLAWGAAVDELLAWVERWGIALDDGEEFGNWI